MYLLRFLIRVIPVKYRAKLLSFTFPTYWNRQQRKRHAYDGDYSLAPFDKHKCIFVHIPKCAGVSLSRSIFGSLGGGHMEMWKYELIFGDEFQSYYKFTVVRNPWDRVYSAYSFLRAGGFDERDKTWFSEVIGENVSFEDFVKKYLHKRKVQNKNHFRTQESFLKGVDGDINLDMIIYFEDIDDGVSNLSQSLGMDIDLKPQNVTKRKSLNYLDEYDEDMINIVSNIYSKDIELFDYNPRGRNVLQS